MASVLVMMHEVRCIPTAPRRVRSGPILAHRWPLLLLGAVLTVVGGLWAWMLFLAAGAKPSDQRRLDQGPTERVQAVVDRVDEPLRDRHGDLVPWHDAVQRQAVHYQFRYRDQDQMGESFAALGSYAVGSTVTVELLPLEPNRNRIQGTLLHVERSWLQPGNWLLYVVVPGAVVLLGWLTGVLQLRRVLVHGDVAVGTVLDVSAVRFVLPEMLRVAFVFRDHRAVTQRGRQWVRVHSPLGKRLALQMQAGRFEPMPVLHDRSLPQWSRMLLPQDFLPSDSLHANQELPA
ncbi:MAG: DUF3592 domain-containing protein [Planctomycetota bacterium]|nr:DUF3592 domain-containing protein [Planctomycetota bacterium]